MWNGPQNKPQGRQCVTHRRPQNLCLKRVPKTVPMKAQNVETVPDKLPNFHCHFIRRLTDISERALKTCLNKSLKHIWNINKHTKNIVKASFKYPGIISKTFLKHLWNMSESSLASVDTKTPIGDPKTCFPFSIFNYYMRATKIFIGLFCRQQTCALLRWAMQHLF